jgi:hypothetical protein
VLSSNGLKGVLQAATCSTSAKRGSLWRTLRADAMLTVPDSMSFCNTLDVSQETCCGMSAVHELRRWHEGGVWGCHSGEGVGLVDGIESLRPIVREHHGVGWVGAEGGVNNGSLMQTTAAKRRHASQVPIGRMPRVIGCLAQ